MASSTLCFPTLKLSPINSLSKVISNSDPNSNNLPSNYYLLILEVPLIIKFAITLADPEDLRVSYLEPALTKRETQQESPKYSSTPTWTLLSKVKPSNLGETFKASGISPTGNSPKSLKFSLLN